MRDRAIVLAAAAAVSVGCLGGAAHADYKAAVQALNPTHYWELDETTQGTAVDSAGDIDGTHAGFFGEGLGEVGVPGPQAELDLPGLDAGNLAFNANNAASIGLGPGANIAASTMTVAAWFKVGTGFPGGSDGGDRIWTNNQSDGNTSFQITLGGGANLVVGLNPAINGFPTDGSLPSGDTVGNFQLTDATVSIKDETWHHVVASRNGNNIEDVIIVVDGVNYPVETWSDSTDTWGTTSTDAQIATRTPGDGGPSLHALNGPIDEVAVWLDRQLTVEEAIALYNAAANPNTFVLGDTNNDGVVNTLDIDPFVLALTDAAGYAAAFPEVDVEAVADINMDGDINTLDIDPFVALLTGEGSIATPEPASALAVAVFAVTGLIRRRR